jgi:hypothetical protein
MFNVGADR